MLNSNHKRTKLTAFLGYIMAKFIEMVQKKVALNHFNDDCKVSLMNVI